MSIKSRIPKAVEASDRVMATNQDDEFWVSGSSTMYNVILSNWHRRRIEDVEFLDLHCTCSKEEKENCPGNEHTLCYHSMAVAIHKASLAGKTLTLFDSFKDALTYSRLGGQLVRISSVGGHAWGVVKNQKRNDELELTSIPTENEISEAEARRARLANNPLRDNNDKFID